MIWCCECGYSRIDHSRDYGAEGAFVCDNCINFGADYGQHRRAAEANQRSSDQASGNSGIRTRLPAATFRAINTIPDFSGSVNTVDPGLTVNSYARA